MNAMNTIFLLLSVQAVMGAFDNLWHHELEARLPQRISARYELALHAAREAIYGIVFFGLAWFEWRGAFAALLAALLVIELGITLADFLEEDRTRRLPPFERVLHTVLTISYGLFLGLMAPVLWAWVQAGGPWWVPQGLILGLLLALIGALHRAQRQQPHPVRAVMMQFLGISTLALTLISAALSLGQARADLHLALAQYGVLAWQAFLASLVLTMPYLSRTRSVFQDFSWLAVSSTVATRP